MHLRSQRCWRLPSLSEGGQFFSSLRLIFVLEPLVSSRLALLSCIPPTHLTVSLS